MRTNNDKVIGTCSLCGGPVVVPIVYHSVVPPTPRCADCGAVAKRDYGPRIPMVPRDDNCCPKRGWTLQRRLGGVHPTVRFEV